MAAIKSDPAKRATTASRCRRVSHIMDPTLSIDVGEEIKLQKSLKEMKKEEMPDLPAFTDINGKAVDIELIPHKLHSIQTSPDQLIDSFCCKWSPDGERYAVGSSLGEISIFSRYQGVERKIHNGVISPCTSIKWVHLRNSQNVSKNLRNALSSVSFSDENEHESTSTLLASYSNGSIILWDVSQSKERMKIQEEDNQINCLEYDAQHQQFVTAGRDRWIRVYDLEKGKLLEEWLNGLDENKMMLGHCNRIFALKYHDNNKNVVLSGSWDDNVIAWDMRSNKVIRCFHGPHIAGQSVDIRNNVLLTGSWSAGKDHCIETWDFGTGKVRDYVQLKAIKDGTTLESLLVYQTMFVPEHGIGAGNGNKMDQVAIAGGSGANCVVMFDVQSGALTNEVGLVESMYAEDKNDGKNGGKNEKPQNANDDKPQSLDVGNIAKMMEEGGGIYCVDMDPLGEYVVYGGDHGKVGVARVHTEKHDAQRSVQWSRKSSFCTQELLKM